MTIPSDLPDSAAPAQAAPAAPPSPYPTVQILQAAMAHRDSIRRSFESQRATLAEAIAAQRQAVTQAVVNTQRRPAVHDGDTAGVASQAAPEPFAANPEGMTPAERVPVGASLTDKLVIALSLLTTPGSVEAKNAAAGRSLAIQQFLDALKALIAEEVSRQATPNRNDTSIAGEANQASPVREAGRTTHDPPA